MAAVLSDFGSDSSRFHHHSTMIAGSGQQPSQAESPYRQRSHSRAERLPTPSPRSHSSGAERGTPPPSTNTKASDPFKEDAIKQTSSMTDEPPSPPSSSSPTTESYVKVSYPSQKNFPQPSAPYSHEPQREPEDPKLKAAAPLASPPPAHTPIPPSGSSLEDLHDYSGNTIKVRDLGHIQSFASEDFISFRGQSGMRRKADNESFKYDISGMPIADIIEMVAGLLTKITTTNDRQHDNLHRTIPPPGDVSNLTGLSSSVLAFHGKNVPSITILSYLSRIHKYCPTTYEVFLSLLVYFDRMTERVNAAPLQALRRDSDAEADPDSRPSTSYSASGSDLADSPPSGPRSMPEFDPDLEKVQCSDASREVDTTTFPLSHFFVVDSFNIHRLVIAGVTCASKFFSDVFYTNSRYAKVCSCPRILLQVRINNTNRLAGFL